jgi:branched-chain amino acid aminotransferase
MEDKFTAINGQYVPFNQSYLHVTDLCIQRGYAVFDFFLVRDGVPRYMPFHLDRFIKSAALLNLNLPFTKAELSDMVQDLIAKNNIADSSVKMILTGGISPDDFTLSPSESSLVIINKSFELKLPDAWKNGASLLTCNYQREIPEAKTINYIRSVRLSRKLVETNAAELLFVHRNWVRECSRSNIFYVKDNCVFTPKSNILEGVTRKRILNFKSYPIQEKDFKMQDLRNADEVFITSTTKGVLPIIQIDSKMIANGKIGSVTKAIQNFIMRE